MGEVETEIRLDERAKTLRTAASRLLAAAFELTGPARQASCRALAPREVEVLRAIAAGKSNLEISREMYLSIDTVKTHISRLYSKLGVADRAHAVAMAYEYGLLVPAYVAAGASDG